MLYVRTNKKVFKELIKQIFKFPAYFQKKY